MTTADIEAPPIMRRPGGGFADFTVTRRFPKIAGAVVDTLGGEPRARRAIEALVADIIAGAPLARSLLPAVTPFFERYLADRRDATWLDLPFFDLEFVFYLALNAIAGFFDGGPDIFRGARREAREAALGALSAATVNATLDDRLWLALLGNEADLSQLSKSDPHASPWSERLVVDERPALLDRLAHPRPGGGAIHLLADNAGTELLADLLLVDAVLGLGDRQVVVHCKPWPMFVSDALPEDLVATIEGLRAHLADPARAAGARLRSALDDGRLHARTNTAWGEPRHFDDLDADLTGVLADAALVLAKGDLNYRRFTGDRDWPIATPAAVATGAVPFQAFALRVLKSDTLVGVTPAAAARATTLSASWRTDGTHALVQRLGAGSP